MAPARLLDLLDRNAQRHPRGAALTGRRGGVGWSLSWAGLRRRIRQGAARLAEAGVEPGDAVAVWARQGPRRLVGALAVHARGAAELPLAPALPDDQARAVLDEATAEAALVEGEAGRRREVLDQAGVEPLLDLGVLPDPARPDGGEADEGGEAPGPEPGDAALLCPTGWSDGTRLVPVAARELAEGVRAAAEALPLDRRDRVLQSAPATHVPARVAGTLAPLAAGAAVAPVPEPEGPAGRGAGEELLRWAREASATVLSTGAPAAVDVWRAAEGGGAPVDRVFAAGDPILEAGRRGLDGVGVELVEVHGPAETGPVAAVGPRVEGAMAPPPGLEAAVRDGVLAVRGPGVPEAASEGGWLATGWEAEVTGEGRVRPRGRLDGRLDRKGGSVAAEEVEGALRAGSPAVARAVAVPVDGAPGALLVPDPAAGGDEDERREQVSEAARRAEPGPERVLVRSSPPKAGLRDHAGEVRRAACAEAWSGDGGWTRV